MKLGKIIFLCLIFILSIGQAMSAKPDIRQVKTEHEQDLLALPCVVSVGIGMDKAGEPAIIIGLEEPCSRIRTELPKELDGYMVETVVFGKIHTQ